MRAFLPLAFLFAVPHGATAQAPCNQHGFPVRSSTGSPIRYTATELARQQAGAPRASAAATGSGAVTGPAGNPQGADWAYFALGSGIGAAGMQASTAGGVLELVVSAGASGFGELRYWLILRYDAPTKSYATQAFVSPIYPAGKSIKSLHVADVASAAGPEVLIGRGDGVVEIWNQATRLMLTSFATAATGLNALTTADLDGNAVPEILAVNGTGLYVYSNAGAFQWSVNGPSGTDVVAAQMDADPALEIATTSGHIVDAATRTTQWFWNNKFGFQLEVADIDNDAKAELIAADSWAWIWCYDVDRQLPKWSLPVSNTGAIDLGDIDKDGVVELMVGDAQWGSVAGYDTSTLAKEWSIGNPEHGTTDITYGDFDADGKNEVLWGAGYSSTGKDVLFVGDLATQTIRWQSVHLDGPFAGPVLGDLDGDGKPEVVTCSTTSDSGYSGGRIVVLDGQTLAQKAVSTPVTSSFSASLGDLQLTNVDADPQLELVIAAGNVAIYDYANAAFTKSWEIVAGSSGPSYSVARVGDYDGDTKLDVVVGSSQFVHIFDFATRAERWKSFYVGGKVLSLSLLDTDFDNQVEIHALSADGNVYVFDAKTRQADAILAHGGTQYSAMTTWEFSPGVGVPFVGDKQGRLSMYLTAGAAGYVIVGTIPFRAAAIDGLQVLGPNPFILSGAGGSLDIAAGLVSAWSSKAYGDKFGSNTIVIDSRRMVISGGSYGLAGFVLP